MVSELHAVDIIMLELQVKTKQSPPTQKTPTGIQVFHASFSILLKQNSNSKKKVGVYRAQDWHNGKMSKLS